MTCEEAKDLLRVAAFKVEKKKIIHAKGEIRNESKG